MSNKDKIMIAMQVIAGAEEVEEAKALFASHAEFMKATHHREGELKLISYDVSHTPEFLDPLSPNPTPSGNTIFLMVEVYETMAGVEDHWRLGMQQWADIGQMMNFMEKCKVTIFHGANIVHSLWD